MSAETIFALASARGRAGVAVIRVSGPRAHLALAALCGGMKLPEPRRAAVRRLSHPAGGEALDDALVIRFNRPASFTGEDVVELHVHGGPAVIEGVLSALAAMDGLRVAEAGEFTRRAFLAGRLDLTEVEGLADLVTAETAAQRRQALRQADGALGRLYEQWRDRLARALAHMEAGIDFADEDVPEGVGEAVRPELEDLRERIGAHLDDRRRGERLRDGLMVVLLGAPNVGKSSLLNRLAERDVAIVTDIAGTTRDVLEVHLDLGGYPVTVIDTAGLREAADRIEEEGVRRALARARQADIRVVVLDGARWAEIEADPGVAIPVGAIPAGASSAGIEASDADTVLVVNKTDCLNGALPRELGGRKLHGVSCISGAGMEDFLRVLEGEVRRRLEVGELPALTRARHREALIKCRDALGRALKAPEAELAAEDARLALRELGRLTGRVDVEDLLDIIFRDFCIGK